MNATTNKLLPFGRVRIRYADLAFQAHLQIAQTISEQRKRRMAAFLPWRPFMWIAHAFGVFLLYIGLLYLQTARVVLWCARALCALLYGAMGVFVVIFIYKFLNPSQPADSPTIPDADTFATAASIVEVYGTPASTKREPQTSADSEGDFFSYNSRISPESLQGIITTATGYVRNQQAVDVSGYYRNSAYVEPYLRTPPGGFTDQQNFEANAWGAGIGIGIMATDAALQYYDHWKTKHAIEEEKNKRGY